MTREDIEAQAWIGEQTVEAQRSGSHRRLERLEALLDLRREPLSKRGRRK